MRVLLTGASSFTGMWFAQTLAEAGAEVVATFTRESAEAYADDPLRRQRVEKACEVAEPAFSTRFGDDRFLGLVEQEPFDVLCCHGADVTDYKSPEFDYANALAKNTHGLREVFARIGEGGRVVLTGSVFEGGEGAGSAGLPHFSSYGLSKALTSEAFRFFADRCGVKLGKFVIPNPFGSYEEPRFTSYLIRTWRAGDAASVNTPDYLRDNIHVSLLAQAYAGFVSSMTGNCPGYRHYAPSGYAESQGAFAERFAAAMRPRLGLECQLDLGKQTDFSEPMMRINTDDARRFARDWDEEAAWDSLAHFYRESRG